jgi:hypothetical protein
MVLTEFLTKCVSAATRRNVESMKVSGVDGIDSVSSTELLVAFIVFILYIFLILLIGKFLWNLVLCRLVSIVKPADSIWQILGLVILLHLLYVF